MVHMSGTGNVFLVADGRNSHDQVYTAQYIHGVIANHPRKDALSIEGVLILRRSDDHSFDADYFNPDGSHGMMCGNGSRCIVRFAIDAGVDPLHDISFTLNNAAYRAQLMNDQTVCIHFSAPKTVVHYSVGELEGVDIPLTYVDVNSDHVVIEGPLDATRNVIQRLRHHVTFPRGVNVNMVEVQDDGTVNIATFERGVEAITGACGTGALSAAVALWRQGLVTDHVRLRPPSGRPLDVVIVHAGETITELTLQGDAIYDNI